MREQVGIRWSYNVLFYATIQSTEGIVTRSVPVFRNALPRGESTGNVSHPWHHFDLDPGFSMSKSCGEDVPSELRER